MSNFAQAIWQQAVYNEAFEDGKKTATETYLQAFQAQANIDAQRRKEEVATTDRRRREEVAIADKVRKEQTAVEERRYQKKVASKEQRHQESVALNNKFRMEQAEKNERHLQRLILDTQQHKQELLKAKLEERDSIFVRLNPIPAPTFPIDADNLSSSQAYFAAAVIGTSCILLAFYLMTKMRA